MKNCIFVLIISKDVISAWRRCVVRRAASYFGIEIKLPLTLLFEGKSLEIIDRYPSIEELSTIPSNCETNRLLAEIGKLSGVKKHFTFHTARHTCATLLVHQGVPITTVQKVLGHTSVKTTQIYSEVLSDTIVRDLKSIRKRKRL